MNNILKEKLKACVRSSIPEWVRTFLQVSYARSVSPLSILRQLFPLNWVFEEGGVANGNESLAKVSMIVPGTFGPVRVWDSLRSNEGIIETNEQIYHTLLESGVWLYPFVTFCYANSVNPLPYLRQLFPGDWSFKREGCLDPESGLAHYQDVVSVSYRSSSMQEPMLIWAGLTEQVDKADDQADTDGLTRTLDPIVKPKATWRVIPPSVPSVVPDARKVIC